MLIFIPTFNAFHVLHHSPFPENDSPLSYRNTMDVIGKIFVDIRNIEGFWNISPIRKINHINVVIYFLDYFERSILLSVELMKWSRWQSFLANIHYDLVTTIKDLPLPSFICNSFELGICCFELSLNSFLDISNMLCKFFCRQRTLIQSW